MNRKSRIGNNRIAKCPRCSYDLTGLPDKHQCPECGLSYDRDSEVILFSPLPPLVRWFIRIDWPKWNLNICFWSVDGKILKTIPSDFFGTTAQAKQFVNAAQRWSGWYRYLVSSGEIELTK